MRLLKASAAANVMVFMTDSTDHVTGKTGLTLTITASKNGGVFASISPTVTERGDGWYNIALTSSHTDTEGDLALHVTGGGADPTDVLSRVFVDTIADSVREEMDTNSVDLNTIRTKTDQLTFTIANRVDAQVLGMATDTLTAAALASSAVTEIQTGLPSGGGSQVIEVVKVEQTIEVCTEEA